MGGIIIRLYEYDNKIHSLNEWSKILNINLATLKTRVRNGDMPPKLFRKPDHHKYYKRGALNNWMEKEDYMYTTTSNGALVKVSKEDFELVRNYYWNSNKAGYVESHIKKKRIFMHRLIMGVLEEDWRKVQVDHINLDVSDNRRSNLRLCSSSQNQINRRLRKDNTLGFTGVSIDRNLYRVSMCGKSICWCKTLEEAIEKRKEAEIAKYGKFSRYFNEEAIK